MMRNCSCGHEPKWHRDIGNRFHPGQVCVLCRQCGRQQYEHSPYGHVYQHCICEPKVDDG